MGLNINQAIEERGQISVRRDYQHITHQPVATIVATLFAFLIFYVIGRICRFFVRLKHASKKVLVTLSPWPLRRLKMPMFSNLPKGGARMGTCLKIGPFTPAVNQI